MSRSSSGPPCAPILLVLLTHLSPPTVVPVLALLAFVLALTLPSPATPWRLEPDLAVSEHGTPDVPRLDELSRSPVFVAALLVRWRCLCPAVLPGCRIGGRLQNWPRHLRRTAPTPRPRCVSRSPAHRLARWRLAL